MAHEKNTRKKGGVGKILLVLVVLLALAVGGALLFAHNEISGNGRPGTEVTVSIPQGSGVSVTQILLKMWRCFKDNDATLVEINPLAKIGDPDDESTKQLSALDAKISLDDNASFRHDGWARFVDPIVPDPFEQRAREHGLHYVHLHGEVGVIGNGAGLVMSSLDAVSGAGEEQGTNIKPANFLDIGGGASAAVMAESLEIVLSNPQVESVFIIVYGGITSCVEVAN